MAADDNDDDDHLDPGPVPGPDAEPTPAERARARSFAELVDKVVAGRMPAAMSAEDRALVETAAIIRSVRGAQLPAARASALVESALRGAIDRPVLGAAPDAPIPFDRNRRSRAPWVVAGLTSLVAVAAVLVLFLRPAPRPGLPAPAPATAHVQLPATWISRPADDGGGVNPQARAGEAAARIDAIFADRLDGYRERTLARGGR
jgi:hypothetical protein